MYCTTCRKRTINVWTLDARADWQTRVHGARCSFPAFLVPYADCSVCAEGYSRGIAYSCRKCSTSAKGSALGLSITAALVGLLLAVLLLRRLGTVVDHGPEGDTGVQDDVAEPKCAACQDFVVKVIPLSTIKIVVVVWQIVYQVC